MDLKETLKYLKLRESTISMILGVVVIIFSGFLLINYFANRNQNAAPNLEIGDELVPLNETHVVKEGEDLWTIAKEYYGDGNKWVEIVRANNLEDVNNLKVGEVLIMPDLGTDNNVAMANDSVETTPTPTNISTPTSTTAPSPTQKAEPTAMIEPTDTPTPSPTIFTDDGMGAMATEANIHRVKEGETLWSIAEDYYKSGYNWVDIAKANSITNAKSLEKDVELIIPEVAAKTPTVKGESMAMGSENAISGDSYTVVKGDNLWDIAVRAYGDGFRWQEIADANNLDNPRLIFSGNELTLPR